MRPDRGLYLWGRPRHEALSVRVAVLNLYAIGAAALLCASLTAWGAMEKAWRHEAEADRDAAQAALGGALAGLALQAAETTLGNQFIEQAAQACGAEVRALEKGRATGKAIRNAPADRAVPAYLDRLCRDYPDDAACRARAGAAQP